MANAGSAARVTPRSWAMKRVAWIGVSAIGLLAAIILVVPAWIDLGMFKSTYLPFIEETLHRRVDVAEVRLALVPAPSIRLSNLRVSDGPASPDNTFFAAERVQLRLKFWPLLRGRFEVTQFVLEKPVMNLLKQPDGTFNYADLADKKLPLAKKPERGHKTSTAKSQEPAALPLVLPSRMSIRDGQLNLETKGQKPLSINGIDLSLENFAGGQPFPYRASFRYPGLKTVSLEGMLSYREEQASLVLKNNRLKLQDLNLPIEGSVTQVASAPRLNLTVAGDAIDAKSVWQILSALGLSPRDTDVAGPMGLRIKLAGPSNSPVAEVRGLFKNVKVEGKGALKGKLSGEFSLQLLSGGGSMTRRLQGNGKVAVRDGALTNVDLIKKVQQVSDMIGLSKEQGRQATTFKTLETDFTIADGLADFKRIYMVNPQMEANGAGTLTLEEPTLNLAV
ncbi:MAG: AsmA family protein, partial [Deltaproteobacteria bacterium]|nr:AsmA family protein [Deltaproteobacteria bacterium]